MEGKIVLVQNRNTKAYLCENNRWSESMRDARRFETEYHALYWCVDQELENTDIVLRTPGGHEVRFLKC